MEAKKSLLNLSSVDILPNFSVRIPTVGEILENEHAYYNTIFSLTASPFQYMVQLDDMGIDYTKVSDYTLFKMLFLEYTKADLSLIFGNINISDFDIYVTQKDNREILYSPRNSRWNCRK